ncbi:hypothetical protein [Henriciella sp.]|uniref:hypothetical protein n=1 Tax=Henriciella sp. TaxID=1968823 RepID=UPI00261B35FE|nr:hypothetical protein [Henriciella sp.]
MKWIGRAVERTLLNEPLAHFAGIMGIFMIIGILWNGLGSISWATVAGAVLLITIIYTAGFLFIVGSMALDGLRDAVDRINWSRR